MATILFTHYKDIPGYRMEAGPYTAFICAARGANCISFAEHEANFLRTPNSFSELGENPNLYGMPLLFPPNRICNGMFFFGGNLYRFPINEPARGHHIHGFLSSTPFALDSMECDTQKASLSFCYEATIKEPYLSFPHAFKISLRYLLDQSGLHQLVQLENRSNRSMPAGLGFHTTFNACFLPHTEPSDYKIKVSVGEEIELDRTTIIPTGNYLPDSPLLHELGKKGLQFSDKAISNHFTCDKNLHESLLFHVPSGRALRYTTESQYTFWMLFNGGGNQGFICVEPQTWMVDAPNSPLAPDQTGFMVLEPGQSIQLESKLQGVTIPLI
ncbi:galactose mutarotase-like enzyme [Sphaerochaeta pleomorpha str. Grapes]|uniref:Galactose mutarotase-like enzyme n=1 Tax=Sphaerochaeta pleomorpha (strain ATCC BAA-1885 / DSM 22778 / Grapes) TaxID=158190 RepID=G8QWA8_SPHPG|nr:aldose 1-epimerase [Sphaerochaeta pleomorpha]AEV29406.1 galactose mutarotase-like enzyme [Sphaerochaeta pleomorpha str. Grapes]